MRTNWINDHPKACTCQLCVEKRLLKMSTPKKIGKNTKCPCGSGFKYKKCHGL
ncbi:MAG: hypothetical protein CL896_04765 [Dehalococcoidia bacterium]|nr:hypothetical protein [Dehalococcoidia bacterium]